MATNINSLIDTAPVRRPHAELLAMAETPEHPADKKMGAFSKRVMMDTTEGQGYQDLWYFSDELAVFIANRSLTTDTSYNYVGEGLLKLHFRTAGSADLQFPDEDSTRISGPFCGMMVHPAGLPKLENCLHSPHDKWVTVFCKPSIFSNVFGLDTTDLPRQLTDFAKGNTSDLFRTNIPLRPELAETVLSLTTLDPMNPMSKVWAEAKVIDLLCGAMNAMELLNDKQVDGNLTVREIKQIEEASQILSDHINRQISLKDLARMVGLNRNKLNAGFKRHFGVTVGDYLLNIRMQRAKELLETRDLQITQVAFEVGFEFPSNFSTSFKRYYGYSPKLVRKIQHF